MRPRARILVLLMALASTAAAQHTTTRTELEGVWVAQSVEQDGKPAAAEAVARTRYTFTGTTLLVRGNFATDREDRFTFSIDASDTPKYLDLTDDNGYPTPAIYDLKDDVLTICLGRAERPAECKAGLPRVTRLVLKKAK